MKTIRLTKGKSALIDDSDFDRVSRLKWTFVSPKKAHYSGYAHRHVKIRGEWKHQKLHHFILGVRKRTDHKDGDGLNNQRSNLRFCTHRENLRNMRIHNKHGFKGIALLKGGQYKPWISKIRFRGKMITIGYFTTAIEAAKAYNAAASKYFGEFARLNPI